MEWKRRTSMRQRYVWALQQQQQHIKAQLQPRPLLQCVEINWVKKICCLRLKWVMGGSVTIVFCLPGAIYRSFWLSLSSPLLNTRLTLPTFRLPSPSIHLLSLSCSLLSFSSVLYFAQSTDCFWFFFSPFSLSPSLSHFHLSHMRFFLYL